ncbi:MAG: aldehyde ferredoxin oxidoreductase N-terminal domain-containing protein [Deltaproteobacteria bacterium]|nr:aldehyde ferredoxin oxidoreductase N-terminal domain-containing protein [Deltaproteobacteria bacterium]
MPTGYMGRILYVDLTSRECTVRPLEAAPARAFLGGMGLNAWLMRQHYRPGTPALSPDNPIILGAGPLVGTGTPGAAKLVATTRFPLNGTISESVGSMRFALNLKKAGFDHVVISGQAPTPVLLQIADGGADLLDAGDLWGRDIFDTTDALKEGRQSSESSVIAIGPAGENGVVFSMALVDKASTLGRGGLGAVMGSKRLKAIVARGNRRPKIHDKAGLRTLHSGIRERLKRFKNHARVLELGIVENWDNYTRQLNARENFSRVFPREKMDLLYGPDVYRNFKIKRFGCPSCFTPDKDHIEITQGPFKGFKTTTTSYLNSALFGSVFDLNSAKDKTVSLRLTDKLDRMGLDMFTFGSMMDFLMTRYQEKALDESRFHLPLGKNAGTLETWVEAICKRDKSASILGEGWQTLLMYLGRDHAAYAPIIKNCDVIWDPRLVGLGTMEFEQIVSLKGPRSASAGSPTYIPGMGEETLPLFHRHLNRMGADDAAIKRVMDHPLGFNVGRMTRYAEDWYTILSSLGICNRHFNNRFYSLSSCCELFSAVTGFDVDEDALRGAAVRIWDTLKGLNQAEGFGPDVDRPPDMWFRPMMGEDDQPMVLRDYFGHSTLERDDIAQFVKDYYDERGWKAGVVDPAEENRIREAGNTTFRPWREAGD